MPPARKILLADPDLDSSRALTRALRQRGFQVHHAPDGSRALEVAVLRHPELVLFDEACTLLDARTFLRILRSNPRTADVPVVLTAAGPESDKPRAGIDGFLRKPFNLDEVLARIEQLFRRSDAAQDLKGDANEIEGALGQLSLPDLLQILGMNRRSGRLELLHDSDRGELHLSEGRILHARVGLVEGEKALFRLLTWTEGNFTFKPGPSSSGRSRVGFGMDEVLLEGMRQSDEANHLLSVLPPITTRLELSPSADLAQEQHPVTAQVVELLRVPRTLEEVLDLTTAKDLDVLAALRTLLEREMARIADSEGEAGPPLLTAAEVHALRTRLFRSRVPTARAIATILLAGHGVSAARRLLSELPGVVPLGHPPSALQSGFGTLARYEVGEALELHFLIIPAAEAARPLWRPFCAGSVGGLLLDTSESALRLGRFFAWEARVPVALLGKTVPSALEGAPAGAVAVNGPLPEALRAVLVQNLINVPNPPPT